MMSAVTMSELCIVTISELQHDGADLWRDMPSASSVVSPGLDLSTDMKRRFAEQQNASTTLSWLWFPLIIWAGEAEAGGTAVAIQRAKNDAALRLLRQWLADESGYDEKTWPIVERAIEENSPSYRRRFSDQRGDA